MFLRKGDYTYKYTDEWEKFNEISLTEKKEFSSNLNIEDITDADYMHTERVKDIKYKTLKT